MAASQADQARVTGRRSRDAPFAPPVQASGDGQSVRRHAEDLRSETGEAYPQQWGDKMRVTITIDGITAHLVQANSAVAISIRDEFRTVGDEDLWMNIPEATVLRDALTACIEVARQKDAE